MNTSLIGELVKLRYKLLWAKTRSRNGRIALFLAGYLLLVMLIALLTTGGIGAAMLAVRSGKAEKIAQGVLTALFLEAVLAANILGFGMSAVFAETELRRYPLTAPDRRIARHLTGILDPFWFLFLALELGLAVGLYVLGAGSFWFGIVAVLLLFAANYLLARVVGLFIDQMMQRKGGAPVLMMLIMTLAFLPSVVAPLIKKNPAIVSAVVQRLRYTPPFGAAAAMIHPDLAGVRGLATIVAWILGLAALLVWLEKRPPQRQVTESVKIEWDSPFDRVGALFGPQMGPLVGHWLRFYARNSRTRTLYLISLPIVALLTFQLGHLWKMPHSLFVVALGMAPMATFFGTSRIAVNQFGYVGGAFRRYFLLPTDPAATLRAASYAAVTIGASVLPIGLLAWTIFVPYPFDARMLAMLLCTGLASLFVLNALGIWVTLFNPRRGNYASNFGNDLSLGGNILLIGSGMMVFLPRLLYKFQPALVSPECWWMFLPLPVLALAFYLATLKSAGPVFVTHREKLLAIVEGRN